jgi:hypothetical protein
MVDFREQIGEDHGGCPSQSIKIWRLIGQANVLLTLDVLIKRRIDALLRALDVNLTKRQCELADGTNGGEIRGIEQCPSALIEHEAKETPEELRDPASFAETAKEVVAYLSLVQTSFEVFSKGRKGYREKR